MGSSSPLRILVSASSTFLAFSIILGVASSLNAGNRKAPTAPTNLILTATTETTLSVSWTASSHRTTFSYKVVIKDLAASNQTTVATVNQSHTAYLVRFLSPNRSYAIVVYAIDAAGNRSPDSNTITARTFKDIVAPTTPMLQGTVLGPSQVRLEWTESVDNVPLHCCSYSFFINNTPLTENINWAAGDLGSLAVVIRRLTPGSTYDFQVQAVDAYGNTSISNVVSQTTERSTDTVAPTAPTNLRLLRADACNELWVGWNESTDDVDPQGFIEYEIYVNGVLSPLPVSSGIDLDFVYGSAAGLSLINVRAVDRSGNTSAASNSIVVGPC